jgi:hypothetical protein
MSDGINRTMIDVKQQRNESQRRSVKRRAAEKAAAARELDKVRDEQARLKAEAAQRRAARSRP